MKIQIIQKQCGGTEFLAQPHRLHLGAQNAAGVDELLFQLPDAWAGCTLALYLRRSDGTQLAPVPLDGAGTGQWRSWPSFRAAGTAAGPRLPRSVRPGAAGWAGL
mgnify:CR=1 FL=1